MHFAVPEHDQEGPLRFAVPDEEPEDDFLSFVVGDDASGQYLHPAPM